MNSEQLTDKEAVDDTDPRIHLAVERTLLAWERTQLAWIRSIIVLFTSGIAIDRGFAVLHEARLITGDAWLRNGRLAGLIFTISGIFLITISILYYVKRITELQDIKGKRRRLIFDPAFILSLIILIAGLLILYFMLISE